MWKSKIMSHHKAIDQSIGDEEKLSILECYKCGCYKAPTMTGPKKGSQPSSHTVPTPTIAPFLVNWSCALGILIPRKENCASQDPEI